MFEEWLQIPFFPTRSRQIRVQVFFFLRFPAADNAFETQSDLILESHNTVTALTSATMYGVNEASTSVLDIPMNNSSLPRGTNCHNNTMYGDAEASTSVLDIPMINSSLPRGTDCHNYTMYGDTEASISVLDIPVNNSNLPKDTDCHNNTSFTDPKDSCQASDREQGAIVHSLISQPVVHKDKQFKNSQQKDHHIVLAAKGSIYYNANLNLPANLNLNFCADDDGRSIDIGGLNITNNSRLNTNDRIIPVSGDSHQEPSVLNLTSLIRSYETSASGLDRVNDPNSRVQAATHPANLNLCVGDGDGLTAKGFGLSSLTSSCGLNSLGLKYPDSGELKRITNSIIPGIYC